METSQPTQHIAVPNSPVNQPKRLRASEGVNWFAESWRIFNKYKLKWIGAMVLFFLIPIALGLLSSYAAEGSQPMTFNQLSLGIVIREVIINLFVYWGSYCFLGGIVLLAHQTAKGANFNFGSLFAGFSTKKIGSFLVLMLMSIVAILFLALVAVIPIMLLTKGNLSALEMLPMGESLVSIIMLMVISIGSMMFWLTPALVMLEDVRPVAAIKVSLNACFCNIPAFLVYSLIWFGVIMAFGLAMTLFAIPIIFVLGVGGQLLGAGGEQQIWEVFIFLTILSGSVFTVPYSMMAIGLYTSYHSIFPEGYLNKR